MMCVLTAACYRKSLCTTKHTEDCIEEQHHCRGNDSELNCALSQVKPCKAQFSSTKFGNDSAPQLVLCCVQCTCSGLSGMLGWVMAGQEKVNWQK